MKFGLSIFSHARDLYASRREPEAARMIALIFWRSMLLVVFLILVGSIAYGEWDLYTVLHDLGDVPQTPIPPPALNRSTLRAAIDAFELRRAKEESLKQGAPAGIQDPSK